MPSKYTSAVYSVGAGFVAKVIYTSVSLKSSWVLSEVLESKE